MTTIDPSNIAAGMRLEITQAFISQMRAVYTGEVTGVFDTYKDTVGPWVVLNKEHWFQLRHRASYAERTCTQTFKSLRPAEPADKSMWLVVVGLTRQVWVRDDQVRGTAGNHWYRNGERHGYTWMEAFEVMGGNPMMRLKVDNADPDQ